MCEALAGMTMTVAGVLRSSREEEHIFTILHACGSWARRTDYRCLKKTHTHTRGDATERGKLLLERNCDSFMYIAIRCVAYAAMSLLHNEFEAAGFSFFGGKSVKQRHRLGRTATAGAIKMSETNLLRLHRCKGEDLGGAVGLVSQCARRREGARRRETQVNWVFNQHRKTSWTKWKTCSYKNLAWLKVKIIQRNHKFSSTEKKKPKRVDSDNKKASFRE